MHFHMKNPEIPVRVAYFVRLKISEITKAAVNDRHMKS